MDFGSTGVGQSGASATLEYKFTGQTQIGAVKALTPGVPDTDFRLISGGTCTAKTYNAGDSCTVEVSFNPQMPGVRSGAVVLSSGAFTAQYPSSCSDPAGVYYVWIVDVGKSYTTPQSR